MHTVPTTTPSRDGKAAQPHANKAISLVSNKAIRPSDNKGVR